MLAIISAAVHGYPQKSEAVGSWCFSAVDFGLEDEKSGFEVLLV